jgi:hypothetical protein
MILKILSGITFMQEGGFAEAMGISVCKRYFWENTKFITL